MGAGKGRVVMFAMEMGFKTVTGVELSPKLSQIASIKYRAIFVPVSHHAHCSGCSCRCTLFIPEGTQIVSYFYNQFNAPILDVVRRRLEERYAMRPIELRPYMPIQNTTMFLVRRPVHS